MQPGLRQAVLRGPKIGLPENPAKVGPEKGPQNGPPG